MPGQSEMRLGKRKQKKSRKMAQYRNVNSLKRDEETSAVNRQQSY